MTERNLSILSRLIKSLLLSVSAAAVLSCSGGGGGGGDERRTRDTAIRIVHGSVDGAPVQVVFSEELTVKAAFAEGTAYSRVDSGSVSISVERANSRGVGLGLIEAELADETEYTIFVSGIARTGSISARLLEEPVQQPEAGTALTQLLHGVENQGSLSLRVGGVRSSSIRRGQSSGFSEIPIGPQTFEVVNSDGGVVASITIEVEDQSEITVLAAGDADLGFVISRIFTDFD